MAEANLYRAPVVSGGGVLLPLAIPRVRGGVWLYGSVRRTASLAHVVNGSLAAVWTRLVPGGNTHWEPPVGSTELAEWIKSAQSALGLQLTHYVVLLPTDRRRRRFSLLLLDERHFPAAFAKFTLNPPNELEITALERFASQPPARFWAPALLTAGSLAGYSYTLTTTMPNGPHFPARLSPTSRHLVTAEIQTRLADLVPPPFVAIHGDLGAWNVRATRRGLAIVDWEMVGVGVPAADELWHALSFFRTDGSKDLGRFVDLELSHYPAAVIGRAARFWLDRLSEPEAVEIDLGEAMAPRLIGTAHAIRELLLRLAAEFDDSSPAPDG